MAIRACVFTLCQTIFWKRLMCNELYNYIFQWFSFLNNCAIQKGIIFWVKNKYFCKEQCHPQIFSSFFFCINLHFSIYLKQAKHEHIKSESRKHNEHTHCVLYDSIFKATTLRIYLFHWKHLLLGCYSGYQLEFSLWLSYT